MAGVLSSCDCWPGPWQLVVLWPGPWQLVVLWPGPWQLVVLWPGPWQLVVLWPCPWQLVVLWPGPWQLVVLWPGPWQLVVPWPGPWQLVVLWPGPWQLVGLCWFFCTVVKLLRVCKCEHILAYILWKKATELFYSRWKTRLLWKFWTCRWWFLGCIYLTPWQRSG